MGQLLPVSIPDSEGPGVRRAWFTQRARFAALLCLSVTLFVSLFFSSQYFAVPWFSSFSLLSQGPFQKPGYHYPPPPPPFSFDFLRARIKLSERQYQGLIRERPQIIRAASVANEAEANLWDLFPAPFQCPHRIQRLGRVTETPKWLCGLERVLRKKDCVVYRIGSNLNVSSSFSKHLPPKFERCKTFTLNPAESSKTLYEFMTENGHRFIDILDIESENLELLSAFFEEYDFKQLASPPEPYPPIPDLPTQPSELAPVLPVGQLAAIFSSGHSEHDQLPDFLKWWEKLEKLGLRPFWVSPKNGTVQYSFLNIRGDHALVSWPHRPRHHPGGPKRKPSKGGPRRDPQRGGHEHEHPPSLPPPPPRHGHHGPPPPPPPFEHGPHHPAPPPPPPPHPPFERVPHHPGSDVPPPPFFDEDEMGREDFWPSFVPEQEYRQEFEMIVE